MGSPGTSRPQARLKGPTSNCGQGMTSCRHRESQSPLLARRSQHISASNVEMLPFAKRQVRAGYNGLSLDRKNLCGGSDAISGWVASELNRYVGDPADTGNTMSLAHTGESTTRTCPLSRQL